MSITKELTIGFVQNFNNFARHSLLNFLNHFWLGQGSCNCKVLSLQLASKLRSHPKLFLNKLLIGSKGSLPTSCSFIYVKLCQFLLKILVKSSFLILNLLFSQLCLAVCALQEPYLPKIFLDSFIVFKRISCLDDLSDFATGLGNILCIFKWILAVLELLKCLLVLVKVLHCTEELCGVRSLHFKFIKVIFKRNLQYVLTWHDALIFELLNRLQSSGILEDSPSCVVAE